MKNFIQTTVCLCALLLTSQFAKAQNNTTFKCENFYGNGITEYLQYTPIKAGVSRQDSFVYYTSKNTNKIRLEVISAEQQEAGMNLYSVYTVKFPNSPKQYVLTIIPGGLTCLNPNGTTQDYCIEGFNCGE